VTCGRPADHAGRETDLRRVYGSAWRAGNSVCRHAARSGGCSAKHGTSGSSCTHGCLRLTQRWLAGLTFEVSSSVPTFRVAMSGDRLDTWNRRVPHLPQKKPVVVAPLSLRLSNEEIGPDVRKLDRVTGTEMEKALEVCF